jgi:TRAP-type uncharacterized transport system substrate-binding protein
MPTTIGAFPPEVVEKIVPLHRRHDPGGHLRGADGDVLTAAVSIGFVTHAAVPEETVCPMTRLLSENLPERVAAHRASAAIALEGAPNGMPIPLHPGPGGISARSG